MSIAPVGDDGDDVRAQVEKPAEDMDALLDVLRRQAVGELSVDEPREGIPRDYVFVA